jgi:hypothetical protein
LPENLHALSSFMEFEKARLIAGLLLHKKIFLIRVKPYSFAVAFLTAGFFAAAAGIFAAAAGFFAAAAGFFAAAAGFFAAAAGFFAAAAGFFAAAAGFLAAVFLAASAILLSSLTGCLLLPFTLAADGLAAFAVSFPLLFFPELFITACAPARRASGTRNGEHET